MLVGSLHLCVLCVSSCSRFKLYSCYQPHSKLWRCDSFSWELKFLSHKTKERVSCLSFVKTVKLSLPSWLVIYEKHQASFMLDKYPTQCACSIPLLNPRFESTGFYFRSVSSGEYALFCWMLCPHYPSFALCSWHSPSLVYVCLSVNLTRTLVSYE